MDIKAYWKAYHAKNRDRINSRRREKYSKSRPKKFKVEFVAVDGVSGIPENEAKKLDGIIFKPKEEKCCACHLPGKHYARNRWFCDAHRP